MLTTKDFPSILKRTMLYLPIPPSGPSNRNGLRLRPDYDVDFTTGFGIEQLTFNSASAGSAGKGKHVLIRTDSGGLMWVPAPAGVHAGWRGIQLVSGLDGQPAGWLQVGARQVYHLGSGYGISWQYPDGSLLPDVSFVPSAPARTNYAKYSKGPPSYEGTNWTITDVAGHPEWSPHGARRFYNNSGWAIQLGGIYSWPGGSAHWEAIVEYGGDAPNTNFDMRIHNATDTSLRVNISINTTTGNVAYTHVPSGGYYGANLLSTSGPNGGAVTKVWCGKDSYPVGHNIGWYMYPVGGYGVINRSTIAHRLEARIGETAVIGAPIFTDGTAETVLAETTTIEDATIDDGPFTLIVDLAPEVYPRGGVAMVTSFGGLITPMAVWGSGTVFVNDADDASAPSYIASTFPTTAARVAVRRQMPGGAIEFYSGETAQSYSLPEGATYTKTGGARLLLGTWAHDVSAFFYPNRPLKRIQVYKHALSNEEIALA